MTVEVITSDKRRQLRTKPNFFDLPKEIQDRIVDRIIIKTRKRNGCVEWTGSGHKLGYGSLCVSVNGVCFTYTTHRIICGLAQGELIDNLDVLHECDNPRCVSGTHLSQGTQKENMRQMIKRGRSNYTGTPGELAATAKLIEPQVREIRRRRASGEACRTIAVDFGISDATVTNISRGDSWRHLEVQEGESVGTLKRARGERVGSSKLSEDDVREIRRLRKSGVLIKDIAKMYSTHPDYMGRVCSGKLWSHVE